MRNVSNAQRSDQNNEKYKTIFMNPKEKFVCALGNGYLQNFLSGGFLGKGFAVVSDKRVYFKGRAFEFGGKKFTVKTVTSTVDLKDVTGTETRTLTNPAIMAAGIITIILGILLLSVGLALSFPLCIVMGILFMLMGISFIIVYFASRKTMITIMFGGGGIAFPLNWYPAQEGEIFQRMLRIAKDEAVEEAENATARTMREVMSNVAVQQQSLASSADELAKYAQLYKDGLISEQEFAEIKARLLTK